MTLTPKTPISMEDAADLFMAAHPNPTFPTVADMTSAWESEMRAAGAGPHITVQDPLPALEMYGDDLWSEWLDLVARE